MRKGTAGSAGHSRERDANDSANVRPRRLSGLAFVERDVYRLRRCPALDTALAFADTALSHDFANGLFALAAASGYAEFELQFLERIRALRDGGADLAVGNGLADANNHDFR